MSCGGAAAVRSLASMLGRLHLSAACDVHTSPAALARHLTTALTLNAWLSLEHLELLSLAVMSSLGELLHNVCTAATGRLPHANLLGDSVPSPWASACRDQRGTGPAKMQPALRPLPAIFLSLPLHVHLPIADDAPTPFLEAGGAAHAPFHSELCQLARRAGRVITLHPADFAVALEAGLRCLGLRDAQEAARCATTFYRLATAQLPPRPQLKLDALAVRSMLGFIQGVWLRGQAAPAAAQTPAGHGSGTPQGSVGLGGPPFLAGAAASLKAGPRAPGGAAPAGSSNAIDALGAAMRAVVLPAMPAEDAGPLTRLLDQVRRRGGRPGRDRRDDTARQ